MKKLFLFATAAAVLCSCSNQPKYIIDGDIAGLEGTVYLYQGDSLIDSAAVKAGKVHKLSDRLAYLTKTTDGRILRSSTVFIRDADNVPVGILGINYDITVLAAAADTLNGMTGTGPNDDPTGDPEPIVRSVADLLDDLIEQSVALVGKPAALMSKDERVRAIRYLNDAGAFLITKSGPKVCKYFGISKYTLYSYLDEAKGDQD